MAEVNTIRPLNKILVANRGEIAIRIMRTCQEMGIYTVAVFSDADETELFVRFADESIRIGGSQPSASYLDQDKIIMAARKSGADAIHPGYGFLSENSSFAERCVKEGITFIGPNARAIEAMGSKIRAKEIMSAANVPVIPGYNGANQDDDTLKSEAIKIGFPVLLKASAGGGGKGMRVVHAENELDKSIQAAKRESINAFGDDALLIEKYFESSRHIEIQIFGDKHGNYIHLGERECSIQRRHQKIIEESPSPAISSDTRNAMGDAAVKAAEAISYDNAGTVEFIYTDSGSFYFLEVNTRLQVEHPVTEMVTGLDLVMMQIDIASGKPIEIAQDAVHFNGHAIECRLYAEDAGNDFLPATGKILHYHAPAVNGVRYDSGVDKNSEVGVFYDPMIAKIIAHGNTRISAINKLRYTLNHFAISGVVTNKEFLRQVLNHKDFELGKYNTHFLENQFQYDPDPYSDSRDIFLCVAFVYDWINRQRSRTLAVEVISGWRNNFYQPQQVQLTISNKAYQLQYTVSEGNINVVIEDQEYELRNWKSDKNELQLEINGVRRSFSVTANASGSHISSPGPGSAYVAKVPRFHVAEVEEEPGGYSAPMPGQVIEVFVKPGDTVKKGDNLLILLSMKMENGIEAMDDGVVEEVFVEKDAFVEADSPLIKVKI